MSRDIFLREAVNFFRNLLAGLRLVLFLPVGPESFRFGPERFVFLVVGGLLLQLGVQFLMVESPRLFSLEGLSYGGALYLVLALCGFLAAKVARASVAALRFLLVVAAFLPALWLGQMALTYAVWWDLGGMSSDLAPFVAPALALWFLLAVSRALSLVFQPALRQRLTGLALHAAFFLPVVLFLPEGYFWYPDYSQIYAGAVGEEAPPPLNVESTYYAQAELMAAQTQALEAQRPGVADLYFLGFGGYAHQDVFWNEVRAVRELFDARFDTEGRSLVLVNNPKTVKELPLANTGNLKQALAALAARMDVDEDFLFLFMTSHGSDKHVLSVEFGSLMLNGIPAGDLGRLLKESGIRNKVVVVSACYSGGFIEHLADDNTLVMTASRPDRNSFGCEHKRAFTYFGQAFFDEQLREIFSFTEAFAAAKTRIGEWEASEGLKASEPQMALGMAIAPKLEALESRLRRTAAAQASER